MKPRNMSPYHASMRPAPRPGDPMQNCVTGPGSCFGYHASTLYPDHLDSAADAHAATTLCNEAYKEGYRAAQLDAREALGIK